MGKSIVSIFFFEWFTCFIGKLRKIYTIKMLKSIYILKGPNFSHGLWTCYKILINCICGTSFTLTGSLKNVNTTTSTMFTHWKSKTSLVVEVRRFVSYKKINLSKGSNMKSRFSTVDITVVIKELKRFVI